MKLLRRLLGLLLRRKQGDESIDLVIEQVVDHTEPRIRLVPHYRKGLQNAVEAALCYIDAQLAQFPPPLAARPDRFASDMQLNCLFASKEEIQSVFSGCAELRAFFDNPANRDSDHAYALLCVDMQEKTVFGSELNGDVLQRDVKQVAVNFSRHQVLSPAVSESEVRAATKQCILDGLITHTMQHIVQLKTHKQELEDLQRILHARLRSRLSRQRGLNRLPPGSDAAGDINPEIERQLQETERQLHHLPASSQALEAYMQEVAGILGHPESYIRVNQVQQRLTRMGIKASERGPEPASTVELAQVSISNVLEHVVTMVSYRRDDMLPAGSDICC